MGTLVDIILLYSPFLVVGILVGILSHVFCGGHNGGYDELRSSWVVLFQLPGNILYGKVRILGGIRSFYRTLYCWLWAFWWV